jgi:hypothetical protein
VVLAWKIQENEESSDKVLHSTDLSDLGSSSKNFQNEDQMTGTTIANHNQTKNEKNEKFETTGVRSERSARSDSSINQPVVSSTIIVEESKNSHIRKISHNLLVFPNATTVTIRQTAKAIIYKCFYCDVVLKRFRTCQT